MVIGYEDSKLMNMVDKKGKNSEILAYIKEIIIINRSGNPIAHRMYENFKEKKYSPFSALQTGVMHFNKILEDDIPITDLGLDNKWHYFFAIKNDTICFVGVQSENIAIKYDTKMSTIINQITNRILAMVHTLEDPLVKLSIQDVGENSSIISSINNLIDNTVFEAVSQYNTFKENDSDSNLDIIENTKISYDILE